MPDESERVYNDNYLSAVEADFFKRLCPPLGLLLVGQRLNGHICCLLAL